MGCDTNSDESFVAQIEGFQSTHPVWGATRQRRRFTVAKTSLFQSTHPVWGATISKSLTYALPSCISIHAPRMGCDVVGLRAAAHLTLANGFQSTHPVWGATLIGWLFALRYTAFQSTHPVWGATSADSSGFGCWVFQSTHPVWGATWLNSALQFLYILFQSTHPVWGATALRPRAHPPN